MKTNPQSCRTPVFLWRIGALILLALAAPRSFGQGAGGREAIRDMGGRYGFPSISEQKKHVRLESRYTSMMFETNSRKLYFNGILLWLNGNVSMHGGQWSLSRVDVANVIDPLLRSGNALAGAGTSRVMLDPGHGGNDIGAVGGRGLYEKRVVLDIAKRVRSNLRGSGITVRMTRETDMNLSLAARSEMARKWNADLFVSIHCNAARDPRAEGIETYVLPAAGFSSTAGNMNKRFFPGNTHDRASMLLAYYVHRELLKQTDGADRGIRRARFDVLKEAPCPAILVECGFLSNAAEERKLLTRKYRESVAEGIAEGIREYVRRAGQANVAGIAAGGD